MQKNEENWLINYIISNYNNFSYTPEFQKKIETMSTQQLILCLDKAVQIIDNLKSTALGRELS